MEPEEIIELSDVVVVGIPCSSNEGSESRCERSGDFYVAGGAAFFLTTQSHHRYPQIVRRTLKLVTHEDGITL